MLPGVEVDLAECTSAAALFVAHAVPRQTDCPRELECIREASRDAFELFPIRPSTSEPDTECGWDTPYRRRTHVRKGPVLGVVKGCEARRQQASNMI